MKIFLGADHAGFDLKNQLREHLAHQGYEIEDVGAMTLDDSSGTGLEQGFGRNSQDG
jgi:ribose 5-phosphate isomerase RpiB